MAVYIEGHAESLVAATTEGTAGVDKLTAATERLSATQTASSKGFASYSTVTQKATKEVDGHSKATERLSKSVSGITGQFKDAAKSAGALVAAYAGYEAITSAIEYTDELVHQTQILTQATGLDVKAASQWIELGKQREISTTQLSLAFKTLSKQIRAAETGSSSAEKAFHALGIPLKELRDLSTEETLLKISDKLKGLNDGAKKTALTTQFFGKSSLSLLPVLDQGSKGIEQQLNKFSGLTEAQQEAGEEAIEMQRKISRAYDEIRLKVTFGMLAAGKAVAKWIHEVQEGKTAVAQVVKGIANFLGPILKDVFDSAVGFFRGFARVIKGICEVITGIIHGEFGKAWQGVKDIFSGGIKAILSLLRGMTSLLRPIVAGIGKGLENAFGGAWEGIKSVFEDGRNAVVGFVEDIAEVINLIPGVPDIHVGNVGKSGVTTGNTEGSSPGNEGNLGKTHQHRYAGGPINRPMYIAGEEAPQHPEWVIATNPAYRQNNLQYWAQAGHDLGVPGFALGGLTNPFEEAASSVAGAVGGAASGLFNTAKAAIGGLPTPHLPSWMGNLGSYVIEHVADWITSGFSGGSSGGKHSHGGGKGGIVDSMAARFHVPAWILEGIYGAESSFGTNGEYLFGGIDLPHGNTPNLALAAREAAKALAGLKATYGSWAAAVEHYSGGEYGLAHVKELAATKGYAQGGQVGAGKALQLSKQGQAVQDLMQKVWPFAAPFYHHGSAMPPANFDTTAWGGAFVGDTKVFGPNGGLKKNFLAYPKWFEGWIGKKPNIVKENLIHEWAHYFQRNNLAGNDPLREGGAEAFARWAAPQIYANAGIPYQNPPFPKSEMYYPWVQRVLHEKGMDWVEKGQFRAEGGRISGFREGGKVGSASRAVTWARRNLGTQQGSKKEIRWAEETGGVIDPWCAEFVSADMKAMGLPLPANPAYSGSFSEGWSGGDVVGNSLSAARVGDLLNFENEHIGIYVGNGRMISGNWSNEVAEADVSEDSHGLSAVIRPHYGGSSRATKASGTGARAKKEAKHAISAGVAVEIPGLSRSPVTAAARKLPAQFRSQLSAPGITFSEKLGIGKEALTVAEESNDLTGEINAAAYVLEIEERNRLRIKKQLQKVLLALLKPQSPAHRKQLIAEAQHLRAALGEASSEIRSAKSTVRGVATTKQEALEAETPAQKAGETGWGGLIDDEGHIFESGSGFQTGESLPPLELEFPELEATLQKLQESHEGIKHNTEELLHLQEERNAELQKTNATIEANSGSIIQSLIAVINGGIGGKVGLGLQTPSVAGSLASY
jgi:NlpC/P60 family